jgi:YHS domain-containing protein
MKFTYSLIAAVVLSVAGMTVHADDAKATKAKPYPLKKCVVSDEELGGGDMKPYVWTYKGQEIKMCCKYCKKDFMKNPDKYMKKIAAAEKK